MNHHIFAISFIFNRLFLNFCIYLLKKLFQRTRSIQKPKAARSTVKWQLFKLSKYSLYLRKRTTTFKKSQIALQNVFKAPPTAGTCNPVQVSTKRACIPAYLIHDRCTPFFRIVFAGCNKEKFAPDVLTSMPVDAPARRATNP